MKCDICGKTHSNSGKPFTENTLRQHVRDAHFVWHKDDNDVSLELTDMIAGDEPDGAYFAIAHELGEMW